MKHLGSLITELEEKISKQEYSNAAISKSSVGWHIEHTLLTIDVIIELLKKSDPNDYKWKFSFSRLFVFATNSIPKGRAQAPDPVKPQNNFTADTLKQHAAITKEKLKALQPLNPDSYFNHPYLGKLNVSAAIKFLVIHTVHHIAIIKSIIEESN